jgi:hypothetical protein
MKMIINRKKWALVLLIPLFIGCSEDTPTTSVISSFEEFPIEAGNITPIVVGESGTYTINFPMDDRQIVDVTIAVEAGSESSAIENEDFHIDNVEVSLLAFSGGGSFDITILEDYDQSEGDETIYLKLYGAGPTGDPKPVEFLAITVRDSIYNPGVQMGWEGEYFSTDNPTTALSLCDNVDIDMFVFDVGGNEVTGYSAATGSCPEIIDAFSGLNDGVYDIIANLWDNGLFGDATVIGNVQIPITMTFFRHGFIEADVSTISFDSFDAGITVWDETTASDTDGNFLLKVGEIVVNGNTWTLRDANSVVIGSITK